MTCRVFGPPVRSEDGLGVCELCFHGATDEEIAACEMNPDPDDLESALLEKLEKNTGTRGKYNHCVLSRPSKPAVPSDESVFLFFQFSPAGVERIHFFLGFFHLGMRGDQTFAVADNPRVFELSPLGL